MSDSERTTVAPRPVEPRTRMFPPLTPEQQAARAARVKAMFERWEREDDMEAQRASWDVLRKALGPDRIAQTGRSALP
jgi:hypothetical protein